MASRASTKREHFEPPLEDENHLSLEIPLSPTEMLHPLIGLPRASTLSEDVKKFQLELPRGEAVLATFADASNVNLANDSGLNQEVDKLISQLPELLRTAYQDSSYLADAPGFDELFILSAEKGGLKRYKALIEEWNQLRKEIMPLSDPRVRQAEAGAIIREEMNNLQQEFRQKCQKSGETFSLANYLRYLESQLNADPVNSPAPDDEVLLTGKYAVDLAAKRRASEIHSALQGDLSEDSRKVLSFTAGHVKHTQELTPIEAFRLLSFADKLSSEAKKGLANQDKVHDSSEWREQRKHAESGANAMLQVDKEFKSLRDQLLEGAPSTQVLNLAKRLYHIAWSDRELGKGVVRAEQARDVPLELLLGRRVAEDEEVTAVVVDLKGGGAFGKGFGIGQFAQLFRQIQQVLKEETGAHFIVREGGGKLVLLSEKPPEEINLSALADKVRKIPQQFLQNAENSERAVLALCDYSQRVALYSYLSELRGETKDRVPFAFMEPTISVDQVDLSAGVTLGAFLDKEINGTL